MKKRTMAQAFDEWMYRYIEDPRSFELEFESVLNFCESRRKGKTPDYGQQCEAYLRHLMSEPARKPVRRRAGTVKDPDWLLLRRAAARRFRKSIGNTRPKKGLRK